MIASRWALNSLGLSREIASALHTAGSAGACGTVAVEVRGIGTVLLKEILAEGGQIGFTSRPGKTVFRISLPLGNAA